jgi:hypothetical protein
LRIKWDWLILRGKYRFRGKHCFISLCFSFFGVVPSTAGLIRYVKRIMVGVGGSVSGLWTALDAFFSIFSERDYGCRVFCTA